MPWGRKLHDCAGMRDSDLRRSFFSAHPMKLATFRLAGRRFVGLVSYDGNSVAALSFNADERGALALVEHLIAGKPLPEVTSPALALSAVQLEAPIPRPRRNVFCV